MKETFKLHGVPETLIFDKDAKFTSKFWKILFTKLYTQLNFSIDYHPQTDGHTKITNQILEYMLHTYATDQPTKWEDYLHLVEFSYNNSYHTSLKMSPFEVLYGKMAYSTALESI